MQKVFKLTNKYIVLATLLIVFTIITNVYAAFFAANGGIKVIGLIFAIILLLLMTTAFCAGWFGMVKNIILEPDKDNPDSVIKQFPESVGEYFAPMLGVMFNLAILFALCSIGTYFLGNHFIGSPDIDFQKLVKAGENTALLREYISALQPEQLTKLAMWNNLILCVMTLSYLLVFFYLPALFFKNKNPFKALYIGVKDLFNKKFFKTCGVFLLIFFGNMMVSVLAAIFSGNAIAGFVVTLLGFYILTASGVGLFYYYYDNFGQSHLGQNVDIKI